jgi:hypothetical protein
LDQTLGKVLTGELYRKSVESKRNLGDKKIERMETSIKKMLSKEKELW